MTSLTTRLRRAIATSQPATISGVLALLVILLTVVTIVYLVTQHRYSLEFQNNNNLTLRLAPEAENAVTGLLRIIIDKIGTARYKLPLGARSRGERKSNALQDLAQHDDFHLDPTVQTGASLHAP